MKASVYSETLLDHFARPRNIEALDSPTHTVQCENPVCGDQLRLSVNCSDGRIAAVSFRARGCTASIACGSALTGLLAGKSLDELRSLRAADVEDAVGGLIPESKHAAALCADAVRKLEAAWKTF